MHRSNEGKCITPLDAALPFFHIHVHMYIYIYSSYKTPYQTGAESDFYSSILRTLRKNIFLLTLHWD